ncbi:acyl-CoA N-acyltransferase [Phascolomyces articulosus]|uniref:Acyl-CoA N-acyltransferase n=1 Tax=Phascolomyces articulosus TaxID=60185 RepID=A0AAD5KKZ3_9FUNG|nr:acyl-CoA N-acyltransferase [Phascolomyces articulosus]
MVQRSNYYIREATTEDLKHTDTVVQVVNEAYHSGGGWTTVKHIVDGLRTNNEEIEGLVLKNGTSHVLLYAFDGDTVVGTVLIKQVDEKGEADFSLLSVAPAYQSKGVGGQLIRQMFDRMKNMGATAAVLEVLDNRTELIAWYKKLGFTEEKTVDFNWRDAVKVPNVRSLIMKKVI